MATPHDMPATAPKRQATQRGETAQERAAGDRYWSSLRKKVQAGARIPDVRIAPRKHSKDNESYWA